MLTLRKVALTGGLSCGKSSVCRIFKELGAYVVSADTIVHQLLSSDITLGQEIVRLLGSGVLTNGQLDRSRIAHIVFQDAELLQALEKLVHPAVYRELNKDYQRQQNLPQPPPLYVAEVPLLLESGGKNNFDFTVVVAANLKACCRRFVDSTKYDQREFAFRMARQIPLDEKIKEADFVITNDGTLSDLKKKTIELYQELKK